MAKGIEDKLKEISIFSECSNKELRAISKLLTQVSVKSGRILTTQGDPGREFMIIVSGQATVRRDGKVLATLGPGDFFGELAVIAGVPRNATITADTDMVIEALNRREFSSLLDESPKIAKKILVGAVTRLHENERY